MAYLFTPPNLSAGIDDAIVETATAVPMFPIMILVFTYLLVLIGGSSNQKKRIGTADYPFWFVLSGLSTTLLSLIFTMVGGIINLAVLGIVVSLTILSAFWFFLSNARGER